MRRAIRVCAVSMSLVAMLPACAPTADSWNKEEASVEHRDATFAKCRAEANARTSGPVPSHAYQQATSSGGVIGILVGALVVGMVHGAAQGVAANAAIDSCMRDAGFTKPQPALNARGERNAGGTPDGLEAPQEGQPTSAMPDVNADGRRKDAIEPIGPGPAHAIRPRLSNL
ncbi:MAG: hypothetical protein KF889_26135 [Alphaproteobacteria bacterium]|nr:hypothetical protein [Alphaproteobacteria bacterium]MCW5739524.1 hypothetical protein [Alphaproteobacteria bacterium]